MKDRGKDGRNAETGTKDGQRVIYLVKAIGSDPRSGSTYKWMQTDIEKEKATDVDFLKFIFNESNRARFDSPYDAQQIFTEMMRRK